MPRRLFNASAHRTHHLQKSEFAVYLVYLQYFY
jgi:hypothetical protein